jgi:hypothetical protein
VDFHEAYRASEVLAISVKNATVKKRREASEFGPKSKAISVLETGLLLTLNEESPLNN